MVDELTSQMTVGAYLWETAKYQQDQVDEVQALTYTRIPHIMGKVPSEASPRSFLQGLRLKCPNRSNHIAVIQVSSSSRLFQLQINIESIIREWDYREDQPLMQHFHFASLEACLLWWLDMLAKPYFCTNFRSRRLAEEGLSCAALSRLQCQLQ